MKSLGNSARRAEIRQWMSPEQLCVLAENAGSTQVNAHPFHRWCYRRKQEGLAGADHSKIHEGWSPADLLVDVIQAAGRAHEKSVPSDLARALFSSMNWLHRLGISA
ncbi:MAG: hypothetical protein VKO39_01885 [Cyanobacteriota bacterium]|nr:hypothetical protein [Cyanobacteriota bacterium]